MTDSVDGDPDGTSGPVEPAPGEGAAVGLLVASDENRRLLREWLGQSYEVVEPEDGREALPAGVDCWLVDGRSGPAALDALEAAKAAAEPAFLPVLYLASAEDLDRLGVDRRATVDELVTMPVPRAELRDRLQALLRNRELSLELAEERARLETFADVLAHDLRNPLSVAIGRLELAREDPDGATLDAIEAALERMEAMIDDVLALAREGAASLDPEPVDLAAVAGDAWVSVETRDATLEAGSVRLRADRGALERLLENLFRNAVEHGAGDDGAPTVRVGSLDGGFFVEDDGPGVPPGEREAVFEARTSLAGGTGLGLATVDRLAEAHGWSATCTAADSGGARFEFRGVETG